MALLSMGPPSGRRLTVLVLLATIAVTSGCDSSDSPGDPAAGPCRADVKISLGSDLTGTEITDLLEDKVDPILEQLTHVAIFSDTTSYTSNTVYLFGDRPVNKSDRAQIESELREVPEVTDVQFESRVTDKDVFLPDPC